MAQPHRGVAVTGLAYHVEVREELAGLADQIVAVRFRLEIERVYPFDDALAALHKAQTRHARGKFVLSLP